MVSTPNSNLFGRKWCIFNYQIWHFCRAGLPLEFCRLLIKARTRPLILSIKIVVFRLLVVYLLERCLPQAHIPQLVMTVNRKCWKFYVIRVFLDQSSKDSLSPCEIVTECKICRIEPFSVMYLKIPVCTGKLFFIKNTVLIRVLISKQ